MHVRRTILYACFQGTTQKLQFFTISLPKAWACGLSLCYKLHFFRPHNECFWVRNTAFFFLKKG